MNYLSWGNSNDRDVEKYPAPFPYPDSTMSSVNNEDADGGELMYPTMQRNPFTFGDTMPGNASVPADFSMVYGSMPSLPSSRPGYMPGGLIGPAGQQPTSYNTTPDHYPRVAPGGLAGRQTPNHYVPAAAASNQNEPISTSNQQVPQIQQPSLTFMPIANPENMQVVLASRTEVATNRGVLARTRSSSRRPRSPSSTPAQQEDPVRKARLVQQRDRQQDEELDKLKEKDRRSAHAIQRQKEELKKRIEEDEVRKMVLGEKEKELDQREQELAETRKFARKQEEDLRKLQLQRDEDAAKFKEIYDTFLDFRKTTTESWKSRLEAEANLQKVQEEHAKEKARLTEEVAALHRKVRSNPVAEGSIQDSTQMSVDAGLDPIPSLPSRYQNYTPSPSAHRSSPSIYSSLNTVPLSSGHAMPQPLASPYKTSSQQSTPGPLFSATRGAFSLKGGSQTPKSSIRGDSVAPNRNAYARQPLNETPMDLTPSPKQSNPLPAHHRYHNAMATSSSGQHRDSGRPLPKPPIMQPKGSSVLDPIPPSKLRAYSKSKQNLPPPPAPNVGAQARGPAVIPTADDFERLPADDKLNTLFAMFQQSGIGTATPVKRRPGPKSDFKDPIRKGPRSEERNSKLAYVREHMNHFIGIGKTEEIMNFSGELYDTDSNLHRQMASYEETREERYAPRLRPMKINFDNIAGAWNRSLYLQFQAFAESNGYGGGEIAGPEEVEFRGMFYTRLGRMKEYVTRHQPRFGESDKAAHERALEREHEIVAMARRNARRNDLYKARTDIILRSLPDPETVEREFDMLDDEALEWLDAHQMHEALGLEGMSSDESEAEDSTRYVKVMDWRSSEAAKRYKKIDPGRARMTKWGKMLPGTKPQDRKRRSNAPPSSRPAPTGKPINLYDADWYAELTYHQKKDLKAAPAMDFRIEV